MRKIVIILFIIISSVFILSHNEHSYNKVNYNTRLNTIQEDEDFDIKNDINILCMCYDKASNLTDVIMLVNISTDKKIRILSIPRDTMVYIGSKRVKINEMVARKGVEGIKDVIYNITNVKVTHYALITIKGFRDIVDALDGIWFYVPKNYKYADRCQGLYINLQRGYQLLDGDKSEQLLRYRKTYTNGDLDRIGVQQRFVESLLEQKLKPQYILKFPGVYKVIQESTKTDIDLKFIASNIKLLKALNPQNVEFIGLPGKPKYIRRGWYYVYDAKQSKDILK